MLGPVGHEGWRRDIQISIIRFNCGWSLIGTGRRRRQGLDRQELGLDVVEVGKTACPSNWGVAKVAVGGGVNLHDKGREEDMHAETVHANKSTSPLSLMGPEAVKGVA